MLDQFASEALLVKLMISFVFEFLVVQSQTLEYQHARVNEVDQNQDLY